MVCYVLSKEGRSILSASLPSLPASLACMGQRLKSRSPEGVSMRGGDEAVELHRKMASRVMG